MTIQVPALWLSALVGVSFAQAFQPGTHSLVSAPISRPSRDLPLHFEPNVGQLDARVWYVARGAGETLLLTDTEVVVALRQAPRRSRLPNRVADTEEGVVRMKLAGGKRPSRWVPSGKQAGISNYFIGNDPAKWRTNVPNYERVEARGVYPGIDLVCYGNGAEFEYDLNVAPWADASQVELAWEGADSIRMNAAGDLLLSTRWGEVVQKRPRVYQELAGRRVEVKSRYVLAAEGRVRFELAAYDRSKRLSIDPTVQTWTVNLDGSWADYGDGVAVDSAGAVYVTGYTYSADLLSAPARPFHAGLDVFVVKLASDGSLVYSTYLGGSGDDQANGIAVDSSGAAYITGVTSSPDFPVFDSLSQYNDSTGVENGFVAELSPSGIDLAYSTYLDLGYSSPQAIAVPAAGGTMYVTGMGWHETSTAEAWDPFVIAIMAPWSGTPMFSNYLSSDGGCGYGIAVDGSGVVYVTGEVNRSPSNPGSNDFTVSATAFQKTPNGPVNAFVTKLDASLSYPYSTYLGGSGVDIGMEARRIGAP